MSQQGGEFALRSLTGKKNGSSCVWWRATGWEGGPITTPHLRLESPYQGNCRHPGAFQEVEPDFITLWGVVVNSMGGEFAEIQALVRDKTGERVGRRDELRRELVGLPWWSSGLRFLAPLGLIPGQRTRFYMLQLRVCMLQGRPGTAK